ncbi:hypothetical protein BKA70DRAFT_1447153 [Coprinopsis sp. MPI-PUGE-AT-0042]|nr:hypothetical protein BKA70DRAFT_1447153 [Coprinopsis sp. MPI-PUGE-AT-0042]
MEAAFECEECGKTFCNTAGLFTHQKKKCRPGKRSIKELLSDARDYWKVVNLKQGAGASNTPRKRPRLGSSNTFRRSNHATVAEEAWTLGDGALAGSDIQMGDPSSYESHSSAAGDPERGMVNNSVDHSPGSGLPSPSHDIGNGSNGILQGFAINLNTRFTTKRNKFVYSRDSSPQSSPTQSGPRSTAFKTPWFFRASKHQYPAQIPAEEAQRMTCRYKTRICWRTQA